MPQFDAAEHGQALPGVEYERNTRFMKLTGMIEHALAAIRSDNAKADTDGVADPVFMRVVHGARMERGDLVIGQIGRDERLGRVGASNLADMAAIDAQTAQALAVNLKIIPYRRHDHWLARQQFHRVRDIAGATTKLPTHFRNQERDIQDVNLVRQDVISEMVVKDHDAVIGE
jgi:hypothetical protein